MHKHALYSNMHFKHVVNVIHKTYMNNQIFMYKTYYVDSVVLYMTVRSYIKYII